MRTHYEKFTKMNDFYTLYTLGVNIFFTFSYKNNKFLISNIYSIKSAVFVSL